MHVLVIEVFCGSIRLFIQYAMYMTHMCSHWMRLGVMDHIRWLRSICSPCKVTCMLNGRLDVRSVLHLEVEETAFGITRTLR